jgi:hypothetical protein
MSATTATAVLKTTFKPPALTSENYDLWQGKVTMLLKTERLWSIVCGKRKRPEGGSDDKPTKAQQEWDDDAERAVALIFLYLGDMAERHITDMEDPVKVWIKIKDIYSRHGFSTRCNIWVRLFSARLDQHPSMEKYVDEISHCCQLLKGAGFEVDEEIQCSALIHGLGDPYDAFVTSISQSYRQKETIKFEELVSQVFDESRRKDGIIEDELKHPRAYTARGRKPLTCWHCKKEGHKEENCWEKHPEKRPGKGSEGNSEGSSDRVVGKASAIWCTDCYDKRM